MSYNKHQWVLRFFTVIRANNNYYLQFKPIWWVLVNKFRFDISVSCHRSQAAGFENVDNQIESNKLKNRVIIIDFLISSRIKSICKLFKNLVRKLNKKILIAKINLLVWTKEKILERSLFKLVLLDAWKLAFHGTHGLVYRDEGSMIPSHN